jgi:hypothetical protein
MSTRTGRKQRERTAAHSRVFDLLKKGVRGLVEMVDAVVDWLW